MCAVISSSIRRFYKEMKTSWYFTSCMRKSYADEQSVLDQVLFYAQLTNERGSHFVKRTPSCTAYTLTYSSFNRSVNPSCLSFSFVVSHFLLFLFFFKWIILFINSCIYSFLRPLSSSLTLFRSFCHVFCHLLHIFPSLSPFRSVLACFYFYFFWTFLRTRSQRVTDEMSTL